MSEHNFFDKPLIATLYPRSLTVLLQRNCAKSYIGKVCCLLLVGTDYIGLPQ